MCAGIKTGGKKCQCICQVDAPQMLSLASVVFEVHNDDSRACRCLNPLKVLEFNVGLGKIKSIKGLGAIRSV